MPTPYSLLPNAIPGICWPPRHIGTASIPPPREAVDTSRQVCYNRACSGSQETNIPVEVGERALSRRRRRRCKFARLPNLANDTLRQMDRSLTDLWRVGCVPHRRSNPQTRCCQMRGANLSGSEQSDGRLITRARFFVPWLQDGSIGGRSTHTHEYSSQDLLIASKTGGNTNETGRKRTVC